MRLSLRPITRDEAHAYIREHHRHHGAPVGELWRHAVHDDNGVLVGVACVGRPVARELDDGLTVEITRVCTLNAPNADSMLYGAARRAADAKGYRRGLTYILASEWDRFEDPIGSGRILTGKANDLLGVPWKDRVGIKRTGGAGARAAGYRFLWRVKGRTWSCPSRPRADKHPTEDKVALGWGLWPLNSDPAPPQQRSEP